MRFHEVLNTHPAVQALPALLGEKFPGQSYVAVFVAALSADLENQAVVILDVVKPVKPGDKFAFNRAGKLEQPLSGWFTLKRDIFCALEEPREYVHHKALEAIGAMKPLQMVSPDPGPGNPMDPLTLFRISTVQVGTVEPEHQYDANGKCAKCGVNQAYAVAYNAKCEPQNPTVPAQYSRIASTDLNRDWKDKSISNADLAGRIRDGVYTKNEPDLSPRSFDTTTVTVTVPSGRVQELVNIAERMMKAERDYPTQLPPTPGTHAAQQASYQEMRRKIESPWYDQHAKDIQPEDRLNTDAVLAAIQKKQETIKEQMRAYEAGELPCQVRPPEELRPVGIDGWLQADTPDVVG